MPMTFAIARAAFQNSVPARRDQFARQVKARLKSISHESNYILRYPDEILEMAEVELRERSALAAARLRQRIDSGWIPENANSVSVALGDLYNGFDSWTKDASSDLYAAVEAAFHDVGRTDHEAMQQNVRRLGQVQVQTHNEFASALEADAASKRRELNSLSGAATPKLETKPNSLQYQYDVFICHASEDKETFVRELAESLKSVGVSVWYDAYTLKVGDPLLKTIVNGQQTSRFGIVVLSHAFFEKEWPQHELEGLFALQTSNREKVILPVWHGLTAEDVRRYNPILAGHMAAKSSDGISKVVSALMLVIRPT